LEGPHDAEANGAECFKARKVLCTKKWTCEPKERVRSMVTPRNLGGKLNVRGVQVRVS